MEGIPASRSTRLRRMPEVRVPLKYSAMKSEVEKAMGMHMISASIDVMTVPAMNDMAPYSSLPAVGFHAGEMINLRPNSLNAGRAPPRRETTIPALRSSIVSEERKSRPFVILSPDISLFQNRLALIGYPLQQLGGLEGSILR